MRSHSDACEYGAVASYMRPIPSVVLYDGLDVHAAKAKLGALDKRLEAVAQRLNAQAVVAPAPVVETPPVEDDTFDFVSQEGELVPRAQSQKNIAIALRRFHVQPTYDEFTQQTNLVIADMKRRRQRTEPLTDINERELWLLIDKKFRFLPPREFFRNVLLNEANKHSYHPVREYLNDVRWDGTPRINRWLIDLAGAPDTEYVQQVSAIVLIAAARRVRQPGIKFDEIVVLEGTQGMDKSSGLRALCPNPDWFTDSLPLNIPAKEVIEQTAGKWIVEVAELSGISGPKIDQLKAMLSRQVDSARMAYGHHRVDTGRQWIPFGTTNDHEYLKDDTGNRRFWPIAIKRFDVRGIIAARDQLWAEAALREASGEGIRLDERFWQDAAKEQEQRYVADPWEDVLQEYFLKNPALTCVPIKQLFFQVGCPYGAGKKEGMRIGKAMRRLGWEKTTGYTPATATTGAARFAAYKKGVQTP